MFRSLKFWILLEKLLITCGSEEYNDPEYQDNVESNAIYDILEKDLVPLFYNIDTNVIPRK